MNKTTMSLFTILNFKTVLGTLLAVLATYLCIQLNLTAKYPDFLIGVAIIFPVVFSISSAYNRREFALQRYSEFKGHLISIYFAFRDWPCEGEKSKTLCEQTREEIREIFKLFLTMIIDAKNWRTNEEKMYSKFKRISMFINELREVNVQSGEISRLNQYVSKVIIAFDSLRTIQLYRTPTSIRVFSKVFIYSFPVIYAPYFASISKDFNANLVFVMPILYSFILISLSNIQEHLENPFDKKGVDDINIQFEDEVFMV